MTIISTIIHHKPHRKTVHKVVVIEILFLYLLLYFPVSTRGLVYEEMKTRLGSTLPSCHNKRNGCHPCMTVQLPTLPSHEGVKPGSTTAPATTPSGPYPSGNNRNSNYKPLGWKCRCGDHFYNP